jgi:hypothetical protein
MVDPYLTGVAALLDCLRFRSSRGINHTAVRFSTIGASGHTPAASGIKLRQRGNVFFIILLGITLFAALTMAIMQTSKGGKDISGEKAGIYAARLTTYAQDVKAAVQTLLNNGVSEVDIRFAHPRLPVTYGDINTDPQNNVFSEGGGGTSYNVPPADATNTTDPEWEFYAYSAMPRVGGGEADMIIVLPNVKEAVCQKINEMSGYAKGAVIPADTGTCLYSNSAFDRFAGTFATGGSINAVPTTNFVLPAYQGCVSCSGTYHFYSVLMER